MVTKDSYARKKYFVVATVVVVSLLKASPSFVAESKCDGPSKLIDITVSKSIMSPPTYLYTIKNNYQYPIINVSLGVSDHKEMRIMLDNIPAVIESPEGWEGQNVFFEESEYMQVFWIPKDARYAVGPGNSMSGFKLVMPQVAKREKPLYYSDGTLVVPIDVSKIAIRVRFKDGTCAWGKAQAK